MIQVGWGCGGCGCVCVCVWGGGGGGGGGGEGEGGGQQRFVWIVINEDRLPVLAITVHPASGWTGFVFC